MQQIFRSTRLFIAALVISGLFAGTVSAFADDRDDKKCDKDIHKAEQKLDKAVHKHGEHSPQAEERRHQLQEIRERCHRDHDHDHDHDHDQH